MLEYTLSSFPSLYPLRDRSTNVNLIKGVRDACNQTEIEAADARIAEMMHPSLLAELDWMEITMPQEQQEQAARFVDGLFSHHLPLIISQRRIEFDLSDSELTEEVAENWDFYRFVFEGHPEAAEALGSKLQRRIKELLDGLEERFVLSDRVAALESKRAVDFFSEIHDRRWLVIMVEAELKNCMARALDHVSSRMRAKDFIRQHGNQLPRVGKGEVDSPEALVAFAEELRSFARATEEYGLLRLSLFCNEVASSCEALDLSEIDAFRGERGGGYGHCGDCSMMFAGTAIVSFDPTCPGLLEESGADERVILPLNFSTTTCCFCGRLQRAESPSLFYSPRRQQIIYNLPLLGQYTEQEAVDVHRAVISYLRNRYREQCSKQEADEFDKAHEDLTYYTPDFLYAVQMGTTAKEEHVFIVFQLADGSGLLMDATKRILMELTPAEVRKQQPIHSEQPGGPCVAALGVVPYEDESSEDSLGTMRDAMEAFGRKDYSRAQTILESLLEKSPDDDVLRKNLAVVYVSQGDRDKARLILGG